MKIKQFVESLINDLYNDLILEKEAPELVASLKYEMAIVKMESRIDAFLLEKNALDGGIDLSKGIRVTRNAVNK